MADDDDDWGIKPDYKNVMTESEQRFGSQAVPGRIGHIDMDELRRCTVEADRESKKNATQTGSYGYGGKFGVEKDRMDKSAVSYQHHEEVLKHASQTDYAVGFGGKYGVQKDRVDVSSVGYTDSLELSAPHQSQKRVEITGGECRSSELRARFEQLALNQNTPVERPSRPAIGRLKPFVFPQSKPTDEPKLEPKPLNLKQKIETQAPPPREESKEQTIETPKPQPVADPVKPPSPEPEASVEFEKIEEKKEQKIEPASQKLMPTAEKTTSNITAVATFEFKSSQDDELSFKEGDTIVEIEKFDSAWWFGRVGSRSGIFPANHVKEVLPGSNPASANDTDLKPSTNITVLALYDFVASQDDELAFKAGDQICNVDKFDEAWWSGSIGQRIGIFPANHVSENEA